jgi:excinuclease ABC subunit A
VFAGTPEDLAACATAKRSPKQDKKFIPATAAYLAEALLAASTTKKSSAEPLTTTAETKINTKPTRQTENDPGKQATIEAEPVSLDPWKVLGRRWHSLGKGFPNGASPDWPLELADRMLKLLEQVAGDNSLEFASPDRVNVRPNGTAETWAEVETKTPESLKLTLAGPRDAIDLDELTSLDVNGPVDLSDETVARITLNLTEVKHARSKKLKSFLKSHLERTLN